MAGSEGVSRVLLSEQQSDLLGQVLPWLDVIKEECFEATEGNNPSGNCHVVYLHNRLVDFNEILTQYPLGDVWNTVMSILATRGYHWHHNVTVAPPVLSVQGLGCMLSKSGEDLSSGSKVFVSVMLKIGTYSQRQAALYCVSNLSFSFVLIEDPGFISWFHFLLPHQTKKSVQNPGFSTISHQGEWVH